MITLQQRRAAMVALALTVSAGGGYIAKDELLTIGQRFCGPTPRAVLVYKPISDSPTGPLTTLEATPERLALLKASGIKADVRLTLGEAKGILATWCNPDRQQLDDDVQARLTKGETK